MSYAEISVERIERLINDARNGYESPADMIADILHWCDANDARFSKLFERGVHYHESDIAADTDMLEDEDLEYCGA